MNLELIKKTFQVSLENGRVIVVDITENVNDVESNVRQAEMIAEQIKNIFSNIEEQKFDFLILLNQLGTGAHYPSPQARKVYATLIDDPHVSRIAVVAANTLLRSIMRFVLYGAVTGDDKDIKFFKDAQSARKWLEGTDRPSSKIVIRP